MIATTPNLQYRLKEQDGITVIQFRHQTLGLIQEEHRQGMTKRLDTHSRARTHTSTSQGTQMSTVLHENAAINNQEAKL